MLDGEHQDRQARVRTLDGLHHAELRLERIVVVEAQRRGRGARDRLLDLFRALDIDDAEVGLEALSQARFLPAERQSIHISSGSSIS